MKNLFVILFSIFTIQAFAQESLIDWVDQHIGSGDHGHVFVGANVPFGMVNVGPTQYKTGWDYCSGYHYDGDEIIGFGHLHLSGTGSYDLGDITLTPTTQDLEYTRKGIASAYQHANEELHPGYYRVILDRDNVKAEMTCTNRVAFHRYTFPSSRAHVIINLRDAVQGSVTSNTVKESSIYFIDNYTLAGYRINKCWATNRKTFFCIKFNHPITEWKNDEINSLFSEAIFTLDEDEPLLVKVSLSPTSEANAILNMEQELPLWDFEATRTAAAEQWNHELARIKADFKTDKEKRIFYTSMYHTMIAPQTWNDVNSDYYGSDELVHHGDSSFTNYTIWSLWDTYRAFHPLATIILRDYLADYAKTMINIWKEQGELPIWHLMSRETQGMVGCPAVPVLADLCLKGVTGFDYQTAFQAMKESLLQDTRMLDWMKTLGYVPYDQGNIKRNQSVSKSLEYYIADWSAAQVAKMLDLEEDFIYFFNRSMGYKQFFDPELKFMRALDSEGNFISTEGFNPCYQTDEYTEGTPWQYTWLVPHDVHGLISCFESEDAFVEHLDSLFLVSSELNDGANRDISGMIGQYAHGNEPSHHILYLYNYVGQPWKGAKLIRQVMDELYDDQPAGLCGNEDVGQMSAWYILSAMGLYQVAPCGGQYVIGSPIVENAVINLGDGKTFTIQTHDNSKENIYVQSITLNGQPYPYSYINYEDIVNGGVMEFYMGDTPSEWGANIQDRP